MPQDPIDQAAATYDGWRELAWNVKSLTEVVKAMENKLDRLADAEMNSIKTKVALMEKDIETGKKDNEALKKELESKTTDNRWLIGLIFSLLSALLGLYAIFKPH